MDMNKAFLLKKEARNPRWKLIDAKGKTVGRLATLIADTLRGKDKAEYTPHTDAGDYVVVINAAQVVFTGNKWADKIYDRYTGWMGGYKEVLAKDMLKKHPERILEAAVKGMLPKNKLNRQVIKKLKIYAGEEHPHKAQVAA
jgi:large subunit ribosomal protein L13